MSRWETIYPLEGRSQFEPRAAVYVIYCVDKGLIYVGETSNMWARMHQHNFVLSRYSLAYKTVQFGWVINPTIKVSYSRKFGEEAMRERRMIRRLTPSLNYRGLKKWKKQLAEARPL